MPEPVQSIQPLNGKVAVVTGAAQGLGLGIAEELALQGATVILADVQLEKARESTAQLAARGLDVAAQHLDITDSDWVTMFFEGVALEYHKLDIVVNNAGVGQKLAPITEINDEEWNRVIDCTLTGTFRCCRAAGRAMERQGFGSIVNIASVNGQNPAALAGAYNTAKAAVISLTRTMALELAAYNVRVNAVCPGPVYTDFNKSVMAQRAMSLHISEQEMIGRVEKAIPLGRWGEPSDIARAVAFLAGPSAQWMTGEIMRVSGGLEGVSAAPPRRTKP